MGYIICNNGTAQEEIVDLGIIPSDITTENYVFLSDCCRYGTEGTYEPLILLTTITGTMKAGDSREVTISGGCPPYTWKTSDDAYEFDNYTTQSTTNNLFFYGSVSGTITDITVTDSCYEAGGSMGVPLVIEAEVVIEDATGDPVSIIFDSQALDCYWAGETTEIALSNTFPQTNLIVINAGCTATNANPTNLTTPEGQTGTVSLSVTMEATGYSFNGSVATGTSVASVEKCPCGCEVASEITYDTQTPILGGHYNLGVTGGWNSCWSWTTEGGGSFYGLQSNGNVVWVTPSTNAGCTIQPIIKLWCNGTVIDTLPMYPSNYWSPYTKAYIVGTRACFAAWGEWRCTYVCYTCGDQYMHVGCLPHNFATQQECLDTCTEVGNVKDTRTQAMIDGGCCPRGLA